MTILYMQGFEAVGDLPTAPPPLETPILEPASIALIQDKYYLDGAEISAEDGEKLLEDAINNGGKYTIFQPIRRK